MTTFRYVTAVLGFALVALASSMAQETSSHSASRWAPVDIAFSADPGDRLAFDIEFSAEFVEESGESLTVPGFWDGGKRFVVRFAPPNEGDWSYVTSSSRSALDD